MIRICFVCLGNICRSPTAEGIMQYVIEEAGLARAIAIDSAGTGAWHVGEAADRRARATAKKRGVELTSRARQFRAGDFGRFDYVVAMDNANLSDLEDLAPDADAQAKLSLLRSYDAASPKSRDVPDPYYGGPRGFDDVFDICEAGCRGLLEHIRVHHGLV